MTLSDDVSHVVLKPGAAVQVDALSGSEAWRLTSGDAMVKALKVLRMSVVYMLSDAVRILKFLGGVIEKQLGNKQRFLPVMVLIL